MRPGRAPSAVENYAKIFMYKSLNLYLIWNVARLLIQRPLLGIIGSISIADRIDWMLTIEIIVT